MVKIKTMALKYKQGVQAQNVIQALIQSDKDNHFVFPSSIRIKFAGNLRRVRPITEDYEQERNRLVKELGEKVGDTDQIKVKPENMQKFTEELNKVLEMDSEVELKPVSQADLGDNQIPIDLLATMLEVGLVTE